MHNLCTIHRIIQLQGFFGFFFSKIKTVFRGATCARAIARLCYQFCTVKTELKCILADMQCGGVHIWQSNKIRNGIAVAARCKLMGTARQTDVPPTEDSLINRWRTPQAQAHTHAHMFTMNGGITAWFEQPKQQQRRRWRRQQQQQQRACRAFCIFCVWCARRGSGLTLITATITVVVDTLECAV